jgi:hypothetical protein
MKFQKRDAYPTAVAEMMPVAPIENVQPKGSTFTWNCVSCEEKATLLHRGTGYCRPCYDRRNHNGTLVN